MANMMSAEIFNLEGISDAELNTMANEFLEKAIFDPDYSEFYRDIFKFYNGKINNNTDDLDFLEYKLKERESAIYKIYSDEMKPYSVELAHSVELEENYESNVALLAEANTNLTDYVALMDPILVDLEDDVDLLDEYYSYAYDCVDVMAANVDEFNGYMSLVTSVFNAYDNIVNDISIDTGDEFVFSYESQNMILMYFLYYTFDFLMLVY
jgi:hypothetical protein